MIIFHKIWVSGVCQFWVTNAVNSLINSLILTVYTCKSLNTLLHTLKTHSQINILATHHDYITKRDKIHSYAYWEQFVDRLIIIFVHQVFSTVRSTVQIILAVTSELNVIHDYKLHFKNLFVFFLINYLIKIEKTIS